MNVADRGERHCAWCQVSLLASQDKWCSKRCRQTAWRFRQVAVAGVRNDAPKRLAYADPPYPGLAKKYYGKEASYAGEVDHRLLVAHLMTYDGWALSTSRRSLRDVLSLTPGSAIICPWVKTHHQPVSMGPGNIHEYVIVSPGRWRQPGPADAFVGAVARGGTNKLIGRKPIKFVNWVFELLGAAPGDTLDDLFPGTGVVGSCWRQFVAAGSRRHPSPWPAAATSAGAGRQASPVDHAT